MHCSGTLGDTGSAVSIKVDDKFLWACAGAARPIPGILCKEHSERTDLALVRWMRWIGRELLLTRSRLQARYDACARRKNHASRQPNFAAAPRDTESKEERAVILYEEDETRF